jgi:membrane-associated phospholipid phosphatase
VDRCLVDFAKRLTGECVDQLQYPFRYAAKEPARSLIATAGIAALILTDSHTQDLLAPRSELEEHDLLEPMEKISNIATAKNFAIAAVGFGAVGIVAKSPRERETSIMLVESVLTSQLWTEFIKRLTRRERPRETEGDVSDWYGPAYFFEKDLPEGKSLESFPSGHVSGIWAAATVLAYQYPKHRIVPILGYGTAVAVCYSRMALDAHWLSDVVVGGLIGYGCGRQVLSTHRAERETEKQAGLRWGVSASSTYMGVRLEYGF